MFPIARNGTSYAAELFRHLILGAMIFENEIGLIRSPFGQVLACTLISSMLSVLARGIGPCV